MRAILLPRYMACAIALLVTGAGAGAAARANQPATPQNPPVAIIFDTDIGNDIDDALALGILHALEARGQSRLLAVTISKDNPWCAPFVDAVNTFYGRPDIPIGVVRDGVTPKDGHYLRPICERQEAGQRVYPHDLASGRDAPEAVGLLRKILAEQPDQSVTMVMVGFSTNLARLLDTPADSHSQLVGRDLIARKCRLLSMMAGMFSADRHKEYNVFVDVESARRVFAAWPTPIVVSGFEVGRAITFPAQSIERDFNYVPHHPLSDAYQRYQAMPYDRETWDLTSVLYAVLPDRGYFDQSLPGRIEVDAEQITQFTPAMEGQHRYLIVNPEQQTRIREVFVQLTSQPPPRRSAKKRRHAMAGGLVYDLPR